MKTRTFLLSMMAIVAACGGQSVDSETSASTGAAGNSGSHGGTGGSGGSGAGGAHGGEGGTAMPTNDAMAGTAGTGGAGGDVDAGGDGSRGDGCPSTTPVQNSPCDITHVCKYPPTCSDPYSNCLYCNCVPFSGAGQWICQTAG